MGENLITTGGNIGNTGSSIVLTQANRWHKDIADFMLAIDAAERIDYPSRVKLQDLYKSAMMDAHLTSVLEKRINATLELEMEFTRNGKPDKKIKELINFPWFYGFLSDLLESIWLGPALFQFYPDGDGWITCDLIPRKHVDTVHRQILHRQTDIKGQPWDNFSDLLFVGKPREIGCLARALAYVIFKNGNFGDWAQFCEIFGIPIREYTYDSADPEAFGRILRDAEG
jgi:phage gp29-like protein